MSIYFILKKQYKRFFCIIKMNEFLNAYHHLKQQPKFINTIGNQFANQGMAIYNGTSDLNIKEKVLSKLIDIFPNDPAFYYYMGYSLKDIYPERALPFHQKSYDINPDNVENLIDLCNLLIECDDTRIVIDMNKKSSFGHLLNDIRLLTLFVQAKYKEYYYKDCLPYLLHIIKERSKMPAITKHDKEWKQSSYLNAGHMFSILGDHEKSLEYTEKAYQLCNKFNLDLIHKLTTLQNFVSLADYTFVDQNHQFKNALLINNHLPNKANYAFAWTHSKIRIGYVSSDFSHHAVSNFILPILKNYNRDTFEVYLFANQKETWYRYSELDVSYESIYKLSMEDAANFIHSHEIDILFDLNGHTENSRLDIFSLNPSPIQVSYLGYPNTTGLKSIGYRITDTIADPLDSLQKYTEKLVRMPKCFLCYESVNQTEPIIPRKTKETIILGALNNEKKNSKYVLDAWKTILKDCPNTKLLIKLESYDDLEERRKYYTSKLDVPANRLLLLIKTNNDGYNLLFSMIDVLLDTFPYSGTTTTCNALFNSVPVVTLYNKDYHCHNVSASLLKNAGLDELVTYKVGEYIKIVKELVNDNWRIDEYKKTIGLQFHKSMNPKIFMKDYENILTELHKTYFNNVIEISI
jgi:predicted O-linked N-acetylglucosamine transferase (SPINDLY family)